MLDFAIFAVCFVVFLLALVLYLYPSSAKQTTIPGLEPSDKKEGNVGDIVQAGGLQDFLISLHKEHGPIASFWIGTQLVVSIGKAELFKTQSHVFDKPAELFVLYRDMMGTGSILFANGAEARKRRRLIDEVLTGKSLDKFLGPIEKLCSEVVMRLRDTPEDEHVPLYQYMYALCMKISTRLLFGEYFFNDMEVLKFSRHFELCIRELEEIANGMVPDSNSPRTKKYEEATKEMRALLVKALQKCKAGGDKSLLANVLNNASLPEEQAVDDCVTFAVKGYSLVSAMTWMLYFLATHPELQDTIAQEVEETIAKAKVVSCQDILSMTSLQNTIKETLRTATVEPWTARCQDVDIDIAGHIIPKKTPVIQALGVVLHEQENWKVPQRFDASRFKDSPQDQLAYCPFGFAGKRQCPGQDFSVLVMATFLATLCPVLTLHSVSDQVVTPTSALITRPQDEVWVTLKKR
ncbi:cytochrome P450 20A1-like [Dermacentor variabilis]|uniref:cytochrome P450 20A1-like n=1 Tax=Dermacentor variabilis TaxID=34621 RepID=UPI003F5BB412